jgi:catechol 2,3-dioxygenase-like lactoylglutathione lyase family enzyme
MAPRLAHSLHAPRAFTTDCRPAYDRWVQLDHIVLWVADPLASVAFYEDVVGLAGVRVEEFRAGKVPFPSVRISPTALIDLMGLAKAPMMNAIPGAGGSAGHRVNHVCLAMSRAEAEALRARLTERGAAPAVTMKDSFGAQGNAPEAFYFADPDGNILEARYYV